MHTKTKDLTFVPSNLCLFITFIILELRFCGAQLVNARYQHPYLINKTVMLRERNKHLFQKDFH